MATIIMYFLISGNNVDIELPGLEQRINMLLIIGTMILGLILLLSLKIYQLESTEKSKEEKNQKRGLKNKQC